LPNNPTPVSIPLAIDSLNGLENWPCLIVLSFIIDGILPELYPPPGIPVPAIVLIIVFPKFPGPSFLSI
jgi:hypothetical protein